MPSKGVDYYSYIALPSTSVRFSGPKVGSTTAAANNFTKSHLEIESGNLPVWTFTGTFQWDAVRDGSKAICTRKQEISSITGNLDDGDFTNMMNTAADVGSDYVVTYGFYDSGSGIAGLTKVDQAWVTVVPRLSDWMGAVARVNSAEANEPFSTFVLAGAHDAGMNVMDGIVLVTSDAAFPALIAGLSVLLPIPGLSSFAQSKAMDIMMVLAMTQKDSFLSMLDNGVRYFDFRPAYLLPGVRDTVSSNDNTLYHTHLVIPGARFDTFLNDIVFFLKAHPTEIVVIRTCADGIKVCEVPNSDVITQFAVRALQGSDITLGDRSSFQKSVASLRASGTRLILVQNNPKCDSYSDNAYATLDAKTIISSFAGMNQASQKDKDFTVLQCQGTSTSIKDVLVYAAATANKATSPLMSTKASFDMSTLPWIRANALKNLTSQQNLIIMNDFIDGATTHTAFELSQARFAAVKKPLDPTDKANTPAAAAIAHLAPLAAAAAAAQEPAQFNLLAQNPAIQLSVSGAFQSQSQSAQVGSSPQLGTQVGGSQSQSAQTGASQAQTAPSGAAAGFLRTFVDESALAVPSESNVASSSEAKPAEAQQAKAQEDLTETQTNEALLQSILRKQSVALDAKETVTDDEKHGLDVLRAAQKEAEATRKAQEEVLDLANKRVSAEAEM